MTTNQKIWSKALLSSYNYLGRLCDSIDNLIEKTAVNSYYAFSFINSENSIENISKKIIYYSNRKIDYINLKIIIERALKSISKLSAKYLILRYIHKMSVEKACEILNISSRSSYRKLNSALSEFSGVLSSYGFNVEKLELEYSSDPFIGSIYKLVSKNNFLIEEKAEVISKDSIFNRYINELMANVI